MWVRIFDALIYLQLKGFSASEVYYMRPKTFKEVYRSVKRLEVEQVTTDVYAQNVAMNGSAKNIGDFIKTLDVWGENPIESRSRIQGYQASLKGKR